MGSSGEAEPDSRRKFDRGIWRREYWRTAWRWRFRLTKQEPGNSGTTATVKARWVEQLLHLFSVPITSVAIGRRQLSSIAAGRIYPTRGWSISIRENPPPLIFTSMISSR